MDILRYIQVLYMRHVMVKCSAEEALLLHVPDFNLCQHPPILNMIIYNYYFWTTYAYNLLHTDIFILPHMTGLMQN